MKILIFNHCNIKYRGGGGENNDKSLLTVCRTYYPQNVVQN